MTTAGNIGIAERSPEAVLDFWLGRLRTAADASRRNWQQGMLRWRIGPFARGAEDPTILRVQREWCEQMHREGLDRFFRDPVRDTPKGFLAKLIVLDQFPRGVYRGTALAYANDSLTASLSWQACEADREFANYNVIERFWIYLPLSHAEDLKLQELSIEKFARWSVDLIAEVSPERRRINQFVSWSMIKAAIEHAETLLLFDRFPHRNAVMQRTHRGGEVRKAQPLFPAERGAHDDDIGPSLIAQTVAAGVAEWERTAPRRQRPRGSAPHGPDVGGAGTSLQWRERHSRVRESAAAAGIRWCSRARWAAPEPARCSPPSASRGP
ncbi:MAG: DUF924 family protein [Immundisolibacterales bacterium]|nr:DUF924 family protein [Immundisolibacterales bacterium]